MGCGISTGCTGLRGWHLQNPVHPVVCLDRPRILLAAAGFAILATGTLLVWDPVYAKFNSDANRVVALEELRNAGWVELPEVADEFNPISSGEPWHFFVSPTSIFGKPSR